MQELMMIIMGKFMKMSIKKIKVLKKLLNQFRELRSKTIYKCASIP